MGAAGAKEEGLRREEVAELADGTGFSGPQVLGLYARFRKLDRASRGAVTRGDLMKIPELSMNPLVERVLTHFGFHEASRINFPDFLRVLAVFKQGGRSDKTRLQVLFEVFDETGDGMLSREELTAVLKSMVGGHMEDAEVESIARSVLLELGSPDGREGVSFEAFRSILAPSDVAQSVALSSWREETESP